MNPDSTHWMNYAIDIAQRAPQSSRRVGVALVSEDNDVICSAYDGDEPDASWCEVLRRKLREQGVADARSIYLTINTVSTPNSFDLAELLREVHVDRVYIGLPDPALTAYLDEDPVAAREHVYRFPDDLQREIIEQNRRFYAESGQNIEYSPYYSTNRISEAVSTKLTSRGFTLSRDEVNANRSRSALASLICERYGVEHDRAARAIHHALSEAFDEKYGSYDYANDARSADLSWADDFTSVYKRSSQTPLPNVSIINVGVGAGYESVTLFADCPRITFVDIAERGLKKVSEQIPRARTIVSSADDLSAVPENSHDLYTSLRTYNSSFFDTATAASEAHRVLKPGAVIIVSVANGFLDTQRGRVIPGLILPGTGFVDLYRGMDTVGLVRAELGRAGFTDIQTTPTNTEIYLSAVAT